MQDMIEIGPIAVRCDAMHHAQASLLVMRQTVWERKSMDDWTDLSRALAGSIEWRANWQLERGREHLKTLAPANDPGYDPAPWTA